MWVGGGWTLLLLLMLSPPLHARKKSSSKSLSWRNRVGNQWVVRVWSSWTDWSTCSRTCGGGVEHRSRTCRTSLGRGLEALKNQESQGKCIGESDEYRVCREEACASNSTSFRQKQCNRYNQWTVHGYSVREWEPTAAGNPCELRCVAKDYGFHYSFGKVDDGTRCEGGMCVNGRCLKKGCNNRLGSYTLDMCGICGGHNDTCVHKKGTYDGELPVADQPSQLTRRYPGPIGYYPVTLLPEGSRHVQVTDHSRNMLALADNVGKYYLNGGYVIKGPGNYEDIMGGTKFIYHHADDNTETLTAEGPTDKDLTVMVLLRDYNPGITYEFWEPSGTPESANKTPYPGELSTTSKAIVTSVPNNFTIITASQNPISNEIPGSRGTKGRKKKKKKRRRKKKKKGRTCPSGCNKAKKGRKQYCTSDAVLRGRVRNVEGVPGQWRIEVDVVQSFKNKIPLLFREFLWGEDFCICPDLRPGKEYIMMATSEGHSGREVHLVVKYVRKFSNKNIKRLLKLRRDELRVCRKYEVYKNRIH